MKNITLVQRSISRSALNPQSYIVELEITAANGTTTDLFVKQRRQMPGVSFGAYEDIFVAVTSPTQIEDFPASAPDGVCGFFRDSEIILAAENNELLCNIISNIKSELQILMENLEAMSTLSTTQATTISNTGITEL